MSKEKKKKKERRRGCFFPTQIHYVILERLPKNTINVTIRVKHSNNYAFIFTINSQETYFLSITRAHKPRKALAFIRFPSTTNH